MTFIIKLFIIWYFRLFWDDNESLYLRALGNILKQFFFRSVCARILKLGAVNVEQVRIHQNTSPPWQHIDKFECSFFSDLVFHNQHITKSHLAHYCWCNDKVGFLVTYNVVIPFWWLSKKTRHECVCEGGLSCTFLAKRRRSKQVPFGEMVFNQHRKFPLMSLWNKNGCCFILGLHRCFLEWHEWQPALCVFLFADCYFRMIFEGTKSQTMLDTSTWTGAECFLET